MVGSACLEKAAAMGNYEVLVRTRAELDLTDQAAVQAFFKKEKPDLVLDAAAKVGGSRPTPPNRSSFFCKICRFRIT